MTTSLTGIRVVRHDTFDRVVLDLTGPAPTATHEAVDELFADAGGEVDWLTGPAPHRVGETFRLDLTDPLGGRRAALGRVPPRYYRHPRGP